MRIVVTGGLGFIGRHLVPKLLQRDHSVSVLDNLSQQVHGAIPVLDQAWLSDARVEVTRGDVVDPNAVGKVVGTADAVVHLAAETGTGQSMYRVAHYNAVNSQGTANLIQAMLERRDRPFAKLVLASSRSVYGEGAYVCNECRSPGPQFPGSRTLEALRAARWDPRCMQCGQAMMAVATSEDAATRPASVYAATKLAQEELVRIYSESSGVPAIALRFQNVYGEGQSLNNPYTGILSIFSTRIRRGLDLPIFEDGAESRDFIHAEDVARAIALAVEAPLPGYRVFNVGSGKPTSVLSLATKLAQHLGYAGRPEVTGQFRAGDIRHCFADMTQIADALAYAPTIDLDQGLSRFVDWVLTQPLADDGLAVAEGELRKFGLMGGKPTA